MSTYDLITWGSQLDEHTRECLAIDVARKLSSEDVLERISDLFVRRGVPCYLRSDNGSEFTAHRVRDWLKEVEVKTLYIEPGSPWENGYIESFNGKLRDELLARETFDTLIEAKVTDRTLAHRVQHSASALVVGYVPPAPEAASTSDAVEPPDEDQPSVVDEVFPDAALEDPFSDDWL